MDIMLFCTFGSSTIVVMGVNGLTFKQLVENLCDRWVDVTSSSISISYKLPCHENQFMIRTNVDMENMFSLARSFGVTHINVAIYSQNEVADLIRGKQYSGTIFASQMDPNIEQLSSPKTNTNLLPNYCRHSKKTLMTVDWSHDISHVGQCFEGGVAAFRLVLSKYVIQCGFDFKFMKNDSVRITVVCTLREQKGCTWLIHGRVQTCNGYFYLKWLNNLHNCGAVIRIGKNRRLNSELVCNVIGDRLRDKPLTHPIDVMFDLKKKYGLTVSYHIAWLGVEKARGEVYSDYHVLFDQLRWYANVVMQYNPGSYANLDFEQSTSRFKRFFISFKSCIDGFNHIRPLLFLDDTFLKKRFKGNLLTATGKDGLFPLAFTVVDFETTANWTWFLEHLTNVVNSVRTLIFISDRNAGLLESLPTVFLSTHHAYCLQHLQANLKDKLRWVDNHVRFGLMAKLHECAYAPTETSFQHHLAKLKRSG